MDTKHTPMISPLPWESGVGHITDATGEAIAQCFRWLSGDTQANCDLIVRAVNSHDQLVAALKAVRSEVLDLTKPYDIDSFLPQKFIDLIDAALTAAGA